MKDKNGTELVIGDKVRDFHGNEAEYVNVSGVTALKFDYKGNTKYVFPHKVVDSEIEKV